MSRATMDSPTLVVVWLSGNALVSINSTSGTVAWMDDRFRTGIPSRRKTGHVDQLSLSHPSLCRRNEYLAKAGG